jgi:hypothetical protein
VSSSRRMRTRTQACSATEANKRLTDAQAFLEAAELVDDPSASAANAVLAGIAAADAACCKTLGERSRGQDHRNAVALVEQVAPGGKDAANALSRLLGLKNDAEYGLTKLSAANRDAALRQARKLVGWAETVLRSR